MKLFFALIFLLPFAAFSQSHCESWHKEHLNKIEKFKSENNAESPFNYKSCLKRAKDACYDNPTEVVARYEGPGFWGNAPGESVRPNRKIYRKYMNCVESYLFPF